MSILFDLPYYSREAHLGPYSGADSGSFPATPTGLFPTTPALVPYFEQHLSNKPPPTPEELRAHIDNIYAGEACMDERLEGVLRAAPPDLRRHLAEVGAPDDFLQTLMREISDRPREVFTGGQGCTLRSEGDSYVFEAETPGIRKENLKLEIIGRRLQLTVSEHQERPAPTYTHHPERATSVPTEAYYTDANGEAVVCRNAEGEEIEFQAEAKTTSSRSVYTDGNGEAGVCRDGNGEEPSVEALHDIEVEDPAATASPAIPPRTSTEDTDGVAPEEADIRRIISIRGVALPPDADPSSIAVSYELGVLRAYIARSTGPAETAPTPEAQAARAAKDKVKELREALRAAEREAVQADMAVRSAAVSAHRLEATRRTVVVI